MSAGAEPIGPGRLVLVVGPSGAGKDTLIAGARAALRDNPGVVFPRRVVTRPSSVFEDHDVLSAEAFARAVGDGAFALFWDAHGHRYGLPAVLDTDIRMGRAVVCNVSRTIVPAARRTYAHVAVVLVTAPDHVLQARLAARGRASDGPAAARIARSAELDATLGADITIENTDRAEVGIGRLVEAIRGTSSRA